MPLPAYYRVGGTKFLIVAAASFGLFPLFWFFRQWEAEKRATGESISVTLRAIFSGFFAYDLFRRMAKQLEAEGERLAVRPGLLAVTYLVLSLAWKLPGAFWLLALTSFLPVYPIQAAINRAARRADPDADLNEHWSIITFLLISAGVVLTLVAIFGTFMPPEPA